LSFGRLRICPSAQRGDIILFSWCNNKNVIVIHRMAEIRETPSFGDCFQQGVVRIRGGILKSIFGKWGIRQLARVPAWL
jgi:hypothetical protein